MPQQEGKDEQGCWLRWGTQGTKRHYTCGNTTARKRAEALVDADRRRIEFFRRQ